MTRARGLVAVLALLACLALAGSAGAARATAVYTYQPFGASGLKASIVVDETLSGTCASGSRATPRSDAWRCRVANDTYDPCFSAPGVDYVVCPEYLSTRKVARIDLEQPLPANGNTGSATARKGLPWALIAVPYAHQCRLVTENRSKFRGKTIYYTCLQGTLVGKLNRSKPGWTAKFLSEGDNPTLYTLRVRAAWF